MSREPIGNRWNIQEHWGAQRPFPPVWIAGQRRTLIQKPPYKKPPEGGHGAAAYCVPQVQSMLLIAQNLSDGGFGTNYVFRWVLDVGQGGARMSVILDALNTQQVSVAGENIGVDVFCEASDKTPAGLFVAPYHAPNITPVFGVTLADGNVQSGQATYTQGFTVDSVTFVDLVVPSMATGWRVDSDDSSLGNALVANVAYTIQGGPNGVNYSGNKLNQYQGGFLPLPGTASSIRITNNTANLINGVIQWGLDL